MPSFSRWFENLRSAPFYDQLRHLRWVAPLIVLTLAAIHQALLHWLADPLPAPWRFVAEILLYAFTGSAVAWVGLSWIIVEGTARQVQSPCGLH